MCRAALAVVWNGRQAFEAMRSILYPVTLPLPRHAKRHRAVTTHHLRVYEGTSFLSSGACCNPRAWAAACAVRASDGRQNVVMTSLPGQQASVLVANLVK